VKDKAEVESRRLAASIHSLQAQNKLLRHENKGLKAAINTKKKQKKHGKALPLRYLGEYYGGAILYSPRTVQRARDQAAVIQQEEEHLQNL